MVANKFVETAVGGYINTANFDELARAAIAMAKERIGAIIIVERDADLSEFVETGICADCWEVTDEN